MNCYYKRGVRIIAISVQVGTCMSVCMCVCLSVRSHISKSTRQNFTKFSVPHSSDDKAIYCWFCGWRHVFKQDVVLTGRNRTGPPCSVGRLTAHAPCGQPARPPAALQTTTDDARRRRQTTDASEQNNTGPLGGPVIMIHIQTTGCNSIVQ